MATTTADGSSSSLTTEAVHETMSKTLPSLVDTLSPEIIHIICSHLDIENVLRFRMVCKAFSDIGAAYMLPEVSFYMFEEDFDRLRAIANHPIISKHVHSLTYFAEVMDNEVTPFHMFVREARREISGPFGMGGGCLGSYRGGKGNVDLPQLQKHYKEYEEIMKKQNHIIEELTDVACLKEVLPKFTSLKEATMSSEHEFYEVTALQTNHLTGLIPRKPSCFDKKITAHRKIRDPPFKISPLWSGSALQPKGKRHLKALLAGLIGANVKLEKLRAGVLDWKFFKDLPEVPNNLAQTLKYLKRIELHIDSDPSERAMSITRCRKVMEKGIIRKLIKPLDCLEVLHVTLYPVEWTEGDWPASFEDIIAPNHKWPLLQEISIGGFNTNRHDVMNFLVLHKDTLKRVCLRDIGLGETSWWKFLPDIRNNLDLEDVCICGDIVGGPEDENPEDLEQFGEEYWDLSTPDVCRDKTRESINKYCLGPEKYPDEVPLDKSVVDKHYKKYISTGDEDSDYEDEDDFDGDDFDDDGFDDDGPYGFYDDDDDFYGETGNLEAEFLTQLMMEGGFVASGVGLLDGMMDLGEWDDEEEEDDDDDDDDDGSIPGPADSGVD